MYCLKSQCYCLNETFYLSIYLTTCYNLLILVMTAFTCYCFITFRLFHAILSSHYVLTLPPCMSEPCFFLREKCHLLHQALLTAFTLMSAFLRLPPIPERCLNSSLFQGCRTHFHWGPHQPCGCLQRVKCNFNSLTVKE